MYNPVNQERSPPLGTTSLGQTVYILYRIVIDIKICLFVDILITSLFIIKSALKTWFQIKLDFFFQTQIDMGIVFLKESLINLPLYLKVHDCFSLNISFSHTRPKV